MNSLTPSEQFDNLAEEIIDILAAGSFDRGMKLIEEYHAIGTAILSHPYYKKGARGQGQLLAQLAERVGRKETSLRYA